MDLLERDRLAADGSYSPGHLSPGRPVTESGHPVTESGRPVTEPGHPATCQVHLCVLDDIATGLGRPFEVGGRPIAVFRGRTGEVYAVDGVCPHKKGPLADGMLVGSQVVCPLHAYRFDGTSGECDQAGACGIAAYPVEVRDGGVYVTVPLS